MANKKQGKAFDLALFRRMLGYAKPYRNRFVATFLVVILLSIIGPLRPMLIHRMVTGPIALGDGPGLLDWTMLILGLLLIEGVLQYFQTYSAHVLGQSIIRDMRVRLFEHMSRFKLSYFDRSPIGRLVARAVSDIETIAAAFSSGILVIFGDILKLIIVIGFMFYLNWLFTLIVLIPIPLLLIATRIFKKAIEKAFRKVRTQVSKLSTFIQEHIQGMSIVQVFAREEEERKRFREINAEHRKAHIDTVWAYSIFFPVVEILSSTSLALLIYWGLREVQLGGDNAFELFGDILGFILFIHMLYRPIRQLADRFNELQMGMVGSERVFEILDTEARLEQGNKKEGIDLRERISIDKVWMAYEEEEYVLKDINVEIEPGQTVAFVGSTGAGKSSLINLIGRFYEFQKGDITIDGKSIRDIDLSLLRKGIAVVHQDVFLFSDSILNNITLHDKTLGRDDVIQAAKQIGVHRFIEELPGGYDYQVAERGRMLSVGQRQLISFLRAYIKSPDILILDEATSSIDTESEELIQKAQQTITQGRTSLVIAHRLSTVRSADKIVVLERGKIVEQGRHNELMNRRGRYHQLYELQFS